MYKPAKLLYLDLEEQHLVASSDNYVERVNDTHQRDFNFRFGSVLGPTLFCVNDLCVNDLATCLTIAPYLSRDR